MPLPTIATPTYELELPSSKQLINYRPFLVKEEKLLVLALESEDTKQITTAIKAVIKSVGEDVEVNLIAPDDDTTSVPVVIPIDEIKVVEDENHTNKIKVDDDLMMEMKYPSLDQFIKSNFDFKEDNNMDRSFDLIASCIDKIYNEEEVWSTADCTKKEVVGFLEQMNSAQFKEIEKFFDTMPKLSHTVELLNPKTKKKSTVVLEGLSSFFA